MFLYRYAKPFACWFGQPFQHKLWISSLVQNAIWDGMLNWLMLKRNEHIHYRHIFWSWYFVKWNETVRKKQFFSNSNCGYHPWSEIHFRMICSMNLCLWSLRVFTNIQLFRSNRTSSSSLRLCLELIHSDTLKHPFRDIKNSCLLA